MSTISRSTIQDILAAIPCNHTLECDGFTRVAYTLLHRHGITARALIGSLSVQGKVIPLHFWLEVDEYLIDYKARMWLGESESIPHGVMLKSDVADLYAGEVIEMEPLPPGIYNILLG